MDVFMKHCKMLNQICLRNFFEIQAVIYLFPFLHIVISSEFLIFRNFMADKLE